VIDVSDAILTLGDFVEFTVTRQPAAAIGSDGRASLGTPSTFTVNGLAHPMDGDDLERLPEGLRTRELQVFYTPTRLQSEPDPDVINIDGELYEVQRVQSWASTGNFFRCIVARRP
jgi:hypothetical protein